MLLGSERNINCNYSSAYLIYSEFGHEIAMLIYLTYKSMTDSLIYVIKKIYIKKNNIAQLIG
jgi:hypothetical protein